MALSKAFIFFYSSSSRNLGYNPLPLIRIFNRRFGRTAYNSVNQCLKNNHIVHKSPNLLFKKKCYSIIQQRDCSQLLHTQHNIDKNKLKSIFPNPRVTLNELATKVPSKVFEVHYKQPTVAPKGVRKKQTTTIDWHCTYAFVWPEKAQFESIAVSKRKAAELAATQALNWLYNKKCIDFNGNPVYEKKALDEIRSTIDNTITATISNEVCERLQRLWEDYECGIKNIYETTLEEAKRNASVVSKESTLDDGVEHPVYGRQLIKANLGSRRIYLQRVFAKYEETKAPLPIDDYLPQITETLKNHRCVIICGAAGCGKSTRVAPAILRAHTNINDNHKDIRDSHTNTRDSDIDAHNDTDAQNDIEAHNNDTNAQDTFCIDTNVIVSQPRRLAAISLASRVASELHEEVGQTVGYQIRLDSCLPRPPAGSILYCTSGILLRKLQHNPGLLGCSHVIVDEVHERSADVDVTLSLLKRALTLNSRLRVVLMSATQDVATFTSYFNSCPVVEVPGRMFPVEIMHLDDIEDKFKLYLHNTQEYSREDKPKLDCAEICEVIHAVDKQGSPGAILVFLPGRAEIKQVHDKLMEVYQNSPLQLIIPVHARMSTSDQNKIFHIPPPGVRKIVLCTNIAETSLTVADVTHCVDGGLERDRSVQHSTGLSSLETMWVSRSSAVQRAGRAGRLQNGHCYRLYTKEREAQFAAHSTPEILRMPLEQVILEYKCYSRDESASALMSQLPQPPPEAAVLQAVRLLIDIGALTHSEHLTRTGVKLSQVGASPRVAFGAMLATLCGAMPAAASALAILATPNLFDTTPEIQSEIREIKREYSTTCDLTATLRVATRGDAELRSRGPLAARRWCQHRRLNYDKLLFVTSLTSLYTEQLMNTGLLTAEEMAASQCRADELCGIINIACGTIAMPKTVLKTAGRLKTVTRLYSGGQRAVVSAGDVARGAVGCACVCAVCARRCPARGAVLQLATRAPAHAPLLLAHSAPRSKTNVDTTTLTLEKQSLSIEVPTSKAAYILKAREMLWNTFRYYLERDLNNLNSAEQEKIFSFKESLLDVICDQFLETQKNIQS